MGSASGSPTGSRQYSQAVRDGDQLGRYRLLRVIGTGAFATVWLAADTALDRAVAIKVLADNLSLSADARRRFNAEAEALLSVESPRVVRGYELGTTPDNRPYLVMSLADRGTLEERIKHRRATGQRWTVPEACAIAAEIGRAVADVHRFGHLHRDIKPSNVLIRSATPGCAITGLAADECLQLADFGLVRSADASALTHVAGTPGYVAPEQAAGSESLNERADVFSVGQILIELLTGQPQKAASMAAAAAARPDAKTLLADVADVDAPLVDVIDAALAADPAQRTPSASALADDLDALIAGKVPTRRSARRGTRRALSIGRWRIPVVALVVALAGLLAVGGVLTWNVLGSDAPSTSADTSRHRFTIPDTWAVQTERSDDVKTEAFVDLRMADVLKYFRTQSGWSSDDEQSTVTKEVLRRGGTVATVTVFPTAVSAGDNLTLVVVNYVDAPGSSVATSG